MTKTFQFATVGDFHDAKSTYDECAAVCDLTLTVSASLRDIYVAGVRSVVGPRAALKLPVELLKMFNGLTATSAKSFFPSAGSARATEPLSKPHPVSPRIPSGPNSASSLVSPLMQPPVTPRTVSPWGRPTTPSPHLRVVLVKGGVSTVVDDPCVTDIQCFYCDVAKSADPSRAFVVHPYVPRSTSRSTPVLICVTCLANWRDFRENATRAGELILQGQTNEELCALCSDTPDELILCDRCPRSFCRTCLAKVLTEPAVAAILDPNNSRQWKCMPCR